MCHKVLHRTRTLILLMIHYLFMDYEPCVAKSVQLFEA